MTKFEYSDFHKFVVSLGTGLVVLAFAIPWFFLRETFGIFLNNNEIRELPQKVQDILEIKQMTIATIVKYIPHISISLGVIGGALILFGLIRWSKKQEILDRKEKASLDKAIKELSDITISERLETVEQNIDDENDEEDTEIEQAPHQLTPSQSYNIHHYFNIERKVIEKLNSYYLNDYIIRFNQRLDQYNFDVIMLSKNSEKSDKLIELKYYRNRSSIYGMRNVIEKVKARQQIYIEKLNRTADSMIFIIIPTELKNEIGSQKLAQMKNRYEIKIEIITEDELNDITLIEIV